MSSFVVRQLVAMVGFGGVAVLVGMPVRAQQVVLTPAGMQMVTSVRAQEIVPVATTMTMEELLKNSPPFKGGENLQDFWTNPAAPIVGGATDYVQVSTTLEPGSNQMYTSGATSVVTVDPSKVKIGGSNYTVADLTNKEVPLRIITSEERAQPDFMMPTSVSPRTVTAESFSTEPSVTRYAPGQTISTSVSLTPVHVGKSRQMSEYSPLSGSRIFYGLNN
jgi:hypothetical protein